MPEEDPVMPGTRRMRALAGGAFLFFLAKGLVWLALGYLALA